MAKRDWDLNGEFIEEPFLFKGNAKILAIVAAVIVWNILAVVLGTTVLVAKDNDVFGVINVAICTAVAIAVFYIGKAIAKNNHAKFMEKERAEFYKQKEESIPYRVCEFCGGKLERKFYQTGKPFPSGSFYISHGMETFVCNECRYEVRGHTCTTYYIARAGMTEYTLIIPETVETSKVTEKQLQDGRLVAYMRKAKRHFNLPKD